MSKSIYDKGLRLIENIYEGDTVFDFDYYDKRELPLSWEVDRDTLERIKQTLKQAQKRQKLLELYKEVNNKSEELIALAEHDSWSWKLYHDIKNIQYKIKELENEN